LPILLNLLGFSRNVRRSITPLHQPLNYPPQLGRRIPRHHLDIANPRAPQRFLLDRVARGGGVGALEMRSALIFDRIPTLGIIHYI
jgi:hypothetical protein